ncbi:unnamed protein product [Urochloa humidicola]
MDQLVWPASFCGPPSPAWSFFSSVGNYQYASPAAAVDSRSCNDVPELWLAGGCDVMSKHYDADPMHDAGATANNDNPSPPVKTRRRGRKPGPRAAIPPISHVEAERLRRDRLNRLFCDLRAAVPTVSRLDRASLLSDAVAYITDLRRRVEQLEAEAARRTAAASQLSHRHYPLLPGTGSPGQLESVALEAGMVGAPEAAARVMAALDLPAAQHACVCRVCGATVKDVVVDVPPPPPPAGLRRDAGRLRAAVLHGGLAL